MANIQVRNVPEEVHYRLKSQALAAGQSLNEYLLGRMKEMTEKLTVAEFNALVRANPPRSGSNTTPEDTIRIIREEREARDEQIRQALKDNPGK